VETWATGEGNREGDGWAARLVKWRGKKKGQGEREAQGGGVFIFENLFSFSVFI
jgi:hypothetical protein